MLGEACALGAAVCFGSGAAWQRRGMVEVSPRRWSEFRQLARNRWFVSGSLLGIAGGGAQILALHLAPVGRVGPLLAFGVLATGLAESKLERNALTPRLLAGLLTVTVGVGLVAGSTRSQPLTSSAVAATATGLGLSLAATLGRRHPPVLAAAAGVLFGAAALFTSAGVRDVDPLEWPARAELWAAGITGLLGAISITIAYRQSSATRLIPYVVTAQVLISVLGAGVDGDGRMGLVGVGIILAAGGCLLIGVSQPSTPAAVEADQ